ncbi:MAG TPA: glycosyltransferase family 2 protein [Gemmatimonadaceae bacterium]|nr:glycosyltransferase family 2 protein [Gemmatimonadaceae bacterium]
MTAVPLTQATHTEAGPGGTASLVSVLIPCYQERDFIISCLESVRRFELPAGWDIEVMVIDGGSTDGTRDLVSTVAASDPRFRLLHNPRRTQSTALNLALADSHGDYVLRLDAHSTYPTDYLKKCVETSLRTSAENVGGLVVTRARGSGYQAALVQALTTHWFGVGSSFRTGAKEGPADTVPYGFFRRETFRKFGLFDERLWRGQDYEFNRRITAGGGHVWLDPRIELDYYQQPTLKRFLRKQFREDAPYNAYMWYLAPYTFTPRHAVTAVFALGVLLGIPLAFLSRPLAVIVGGILAIYLVLAVSASVQQAVRYRRPAHVLLLPLSFLAYHLTHGVGVLGGLARIALGIQPVRRTDARWRVTAPRAALIGAARSLVSVIVPCYQERDFIIPCLDSVKSFLLPPNWDIEVLVIDGGSTDGTRDLVAAVAANDNRFRLLHNPKRTQSTGLNLALAASTGEYVLRLDAHSTYPADYLTKCVETSLRTGADNVGGLFLTRARGTGYEASLVQALTTHWFGVGISFRTTAKEGPADTVPYGFFRRETFERFGLFDERLWRGQDYEFNRRISARGGRVWLDPRIVLDYFQQPTLGRFLQKQFLADAPFNAYMWYLAPYTFTPRHAITAVFALGVLLGVPLAFFSRSVAYVVAAILAVYAALALVASVQQAIRYRRPAHVLLLPPCFLAYHLTHGIGVLVGVLKLLVGGQPVRRDDPAWTVQDSAVRQ